jgi:hypothetical protein
MAGIFVPSLTPAPILPSRWLIRVGKGPSPPPEPSPIEGKGRFCEPRLPTYLPLSTVEGEGKLYRGREWQKTFPSQPQVGEERHIHSSQGGTHAR